MCLNVKESLWGKKKKVLFCCRMMCSELAAVEELNLRSKAGNRSRSGPGPKVKLNIAR